MSTNSLKVRFIKAIPQTAGSNNTYGDCILITGEKNGVIDLGYDPALTRLRYYITQDIMPDSITGKRKIDYIILTHYHNDHVTSDIVSALTTLTETSEPSLDLSNCKVYLPHNGIDWTLMHFNNPSDVSILAARETNCRNALVGPDGSGGLVGAGKIEDAVDTIEGSTYSIGTNENDKITFYNVDPSHYNTYYEYRGNSQNSHPTNPVRPPDTDYNAFSMMTILEHCGHKFVFTGDMSKPAQDYYYNLMRDCDVYKVEHHGLEYHTNALWLNELNPKYAVICQYSDLSDDYYSTYFPRDDEFTYRKTVQHLSARGTQIFSTYDSDSVLIESTEDDLKVLSGAIYSYPYGDVGFNTTLPYFFASRNLLTIDEDEYKIVGGGFSRYGNMILVQMMVRVKVAKAANNYWQIAAGFPRPFDVGVPQYYPQPETNNSNNVLHYWHAPIQIIRYGNRTEHYTGWIAPSVNDGGVLRVGVGATNIPQDSTLYISGVYLARNGD